jgi:hypothetical protein
VTAPASRYDLWPQDPKIPWSHAVLATLSSSYPPPEGRLPTRYSPVRRSTQGVAPPFSLDLHVLGTPPAFVLSQDQTLHLITLSGQNRRSVRTSHSLFSFQRSRRTRPVHFHEAGLTNLRKRPTPVKRYFPNRGNSFEGESCRRGDERMYRSRRRDARKKRLLPEKITGGRRPRTPSSRSSGGSPRGTGGGRPDRSPAPRSPPPRPAR